MLILPLPLKILSCVISTLCRKPCKRVLLKIRDSRVSTGSGVTSDPPCWSILLSKISLSLESRYFRCTDTESSTFTTPSNNCTDLGKSLFLRHGDQFRQPISWMDSAWSEENCLHDWRSRIWRNGVSAIPHVPVRPVPF